MQPRRREVPRRSRRRQLAFLLRGASCPSFLHGPAPGNATTNTRSSTKITRKTTGVSSSWRFVSFVSSWSRHLEMQPRRHEAPRRTRRRQLTFLLRGASCPSSLRGPGTWKCNHEDAKFHEEHEEDNWRFFFVALRVLRAFTARHLEMQPRRREAPRRTRRRQLTFLLRGASCPSS